MPEEKFRRDEEFKTIEIIDKNRKHENASHKIQKEKKSIDFIGDRDEIMRQFQSNFINIYEGKPLENTYIPEANSQFIHNEYTQEDFFEKKIYNENKIEEIKKKNPKKEKIQKILKEIERKKMKKIEMAGPKNRRVY